MKDIKRVLTIAGSDSGGGAGIQADLKTFQELHVYGMSAITAVTAQNTLGVQAVYPLPAEAVCQQIDSVAQDLGVHAVKTGMLYDAELIVAVAEKIKQYRWNHFVLDPVMIAKGGTPLLKQDARTALIEHLIPLCELITPNIPEAEQLTGISIRTMEDRQDAAQILFEMGAKGVVIKGGHDEQTETNATDLLYDGREFHLFASKRIQTIHTHGTGCTYAAVITAELAKGKRAKEAVQTAKRFIQAAIEESLRIGHGHGPTNHWAYMASRKET